MKDKAKITSTIKITNSEFRLLIVLVIVIFTLPSVSLHYIPPTQFRLIAILGLIFIAVLGVCWAAILRRFGQILRAREEATRSHRQTPERIPALLRYLLRAEYKETADIRLISACHRLRTILFGYFACIGVFILFAAVMWPRY